LRLGRQLSQLGQHNAARTVFDLLTTRYPNSTTAWHGLSLAREALGEADAADTAMNRARELDPIDDLVLQPLPR
jgi:Flp pilus assembly protein TadD